MNEWINIDEKLPDDDQYIIGYCQNYPVNFVSMVRFEKQKNSHYFWNDALDQKANVTHWMPLPDPPS